MENGNYYIIRPMLPGAGWGWFRGGSSLAKNSGEGWHTAPWWVVENYMYKRLLEDGLVDFRVECGAYIE